MVAMMVPEIPPSFEELMHLKAQLQAARLLYWHTDVLLTFQWWFSVVAALFFIGLWVRLHKRARLAETSLYGLQWAAAATYLDNVGTSFMLWEYPYTILPYTSKSLSADLTSIPISFMLVYQYCPTPPAFARGTLAIAAFFAFVMEPFLVWLGIYKLYRWSYLCSFVLYILLSYLFRKIAKSIVAASSSSE